jgi:hypothetical protein
MRSLFNLVIWVILAPFKIIKFIVSDVIIIGIIGRIISMVKTVLRAVFKIIFSPLTMIILLGGAVAYVYLTEEQKKKVNALMGM